VVEPKGRQDSELCDRTTSHGPRRCRMMLQTIFSNGGPGPQRNPIGTRVNQVSTLKMYIDSFGTAFYR